MHNEKIKISTVIICFFLPMLAFAQEKFSVSEQLVIEGNVNNRLTFTIKDLSNFPSTAIDSFVIYNHLHERKRALKNVKGALLKDILDKAGISEKNPKLLGEYYFTCVATDGYKVVFSWNEIFNTEVGKGIIVVMEEDGMHAETLPDRIVLLSSKDFSTGRRYIKGLVKIIADRVK
ncbi:MAG TPA: hypothetical protein VMT76_07305 [Puia sp.]|nr:hypothetical protein [Puia sp.]